MNDFDKILKGFGDISSLVKFLNEKINDGQEISRGKDPNDKSKEQKMNEAEPPKGGDAAGGGEAAAPIIDPAAAPGSQINIGNKQLDPEFSSYTDKINISGKKDIINVKPRAQINQSNGTY